MALEHRSSAAQTHLRDDVLLLQTDERLSALMYSLLALTAHLLELLSARIGAFRLSVNLAFIACNMDPVRTLNLLDC